MKKLGTLLIALISIFMVNAQQFETAMDYAIIEDIKDKGQEYSPYNIQLVKTHSQEPLASFTISDPDNFETVIISKLQNPGLNGVDEVIKVDIEYLACCAFVETYYFLATEDADFIALPQIENTYCKESLSELSYTFPNQEYGVVNNILKTEKQYTTLGEIKYVGLKQSYAWNDDDFGTVGLAMK